MRLKVRLLRQYDKLLKRASLYRQQEFLHIIEEVAHDYTCKRYLDECFATSDYCEVFQQVHSELVNAALLEESDCTLLDLCDECIERLEYDETNI